MTVDQWAAIGQVAGAIFTFIGVVVSLYVAVKALREVQTDRRIGQSPYLAFEPGGQRCPIEFKKVNRENWDQRLKLPDGAEFVGLRTDEGKVVFEYGKLCNYGRGPAIHARIVWMPTEVWVGSERFVVDDSKLSEIKYSRDWNIIPASTFSR